jgi:hypothetical protein
MPKAQFSEFQFAYSLTRELGRRVFDGPDWFPHFPTQPQEAERGYDLNFSNGFSSLFIQYKRSKRLDDGRAKDEHWNFYNEPFYRFEVDTSSSTVGMAQHELLVRLADGDEPVYYVAPEFVSWSEYQQHARGDRLIENSAFIDCEEAPTRRDGEQHYICHGPEDGVARFFSEPDDPPQLVAIQGTSNLREQVLEQAQVYGSFEEARERFRELRLEVMDYLELQDVDFGQYSETDEIEWALEQQRFFQEMMGISLQFFSRIQRRITHRA